MGYYHEPVMLREVLNNLNLINGGLYADGTLGGGGHSEAILNMIGQTGQLYGIDRDKDAINAASKRLAKYSGFHPIWGNFHDVRNLLGGLPPLDGGLLDLGVSSFQLDSAARGFSYHESAPLDMRMDQLSGEMASEWLANAEEHEIANALYKYGDEKWAARIAKILIERRKQSPILNTSDLVSVVDAAIPKAVRRKDEGHPARRTFQAVRIVVNNEIEPLETTLNDWVKLLKSGGRLCVITFHSIEDRIVKFAFRKMQSPCICPPKAPICTCGLKPFAKVIAGGAIKPSNEEVQSNPRARSAKLRVIERL
jgi:16S rRNA (cytosine1402-N4)-methyltransferase